MRGAGSYEETEATRASRVASPIGPVGGFRNGLRSGEKAPTAAPAAGKKHQFAPRRRHETTNSAPET